MKLMHIFLGKARPDTTSGVSKAVYNLAKYQAMSGIDTYVIGITDKLKRDKLSAPSMFWSTYLRKRKIRFLIDDSLLPTIAAIRPDVVHFHSVFIPEFQVVGSALRRIRIPYVTTPHGGYRVRALTRSRIRKMLWFYSFENIFLKKCRMIHFVTQDELREFLCLNMRCNAMKVVVPNGVGTLPKIDIHRARRELLGHFRLPVDTLVVMFLGRLDIDHKGIDLLVHSYATFLEKAHCAKSLLLLVGPDENGSVAKIYKMAVKFGVSGKILVHSAVFGREKYTFMAGVDIFVLPSRYEGLPVAVLEALSVGARCVISSAAGIADDIVSYNAGWVCEPTVDDITTQLLDAHKSTKSMKMIDKIADNAKRLVVEKYSYDKIVGELSRYYEKILQKP